MNKIFLLILFIVVKSLYVPLNKRKSTYYWKSKLDDKIWFMPIFVVPYVGYFLFIIVSIVGLWNSVHIDNFLISYIIAYLIAELFWYFFPNGVKRPMITGGGHLKKIVAFIYLHDGDTNGFPSGHVFGTLICSYYFSLAFPSMAVGTWIFGSLIIASTVLIKQHYLVDILGGFFVFIASLYLGSLFI